MRAWLRRQKHALKLDVPCAHRRRQYSMGQGVHPSLSMASNPTAGQVVSVCVNLAYVAISICMHARQSREQKGTNFTNTGKGQMLPWTSMVKRHHVMACNQLGSSVRLPTLLPTLEAFAASIGTLNRAGAYTLARACASAL